MKVAFTIPGPAQAWQRAGVNTRTGRHFTKPETVKYENLVKQYGALAMRGNVPFSSAVSMAITVKRRPAESTSKKRKAMMLDGSIRPTMRPDADNYFKACADALNGIVYLDDSQIVELHVSKVYAEIPGMDVVIETLGEPDATAE